MVLRFTLPAALLTAACSLVAACGAEAEQHIEASEAASRARDRTPAADAGAGPDAAPDAAPRPRDETRTYSTREEVWIFSADMKTTLGCLTCNRFDSDSVWNAFGTYGSRHASDTIWNPYGTYGSPYSSTSPWNAFASSPPVLYTKDKSAYFGLLTKAWVSGRTSLYQAQRLLAGGPDQDR